jgi:hypothetical protein
VEAVIRFAEQEIVVAFNHAGREILRKAGAADHVDLDPAEVRRLRHAVITHNHLPQFASTFSIADLRVASLARVTEVRVVTTEATFVLGPPPSGWTYDWAERIFLPAWEQERSRLISETLDKVLRGEVTREEANPVILHNTWVRVAQRLRMRYGRDEERSE